MFFSRHRSTCALAASISFIALQTLPLAAQGGINYPIVFTEPAALAAVGIQVKGAGEDGGQPQPPFPVGCYDHNGSSLAYAPITISNELLQRYKAKGFTRQTLCMALVSQARFDPETGERLPTYVFRDDAAIDQALDSDGESMAVDERIVPRVFRSKQDLLSGIAAFKRRDFGRLSAKQLEVLAKSTTPFSEEQPLAVPLCFKNGTPFLDCSRRHGLKKGKKFTPDETQFIRDIGRAIDRQFRDAIEKGHQPEGVFVEDERYLARDGNFQGIRDGIYEGQPESVRVPDDLMNKEESVAWYDIGPGFARGYGYALHARQPADPAFSAESLEPSRHSSRFSIDRIKQAIASFASGSDSERSEPESEEQ